MQSLCRSFLMLLIVLLSAVAVQAEPPLPAALQEFPRYPNAIVMATMDMGGSTTATFEVAAELGAVIDFFNAQLPGQGWSKTMEARQNDGAIANYAKGNTSLSVGVGQQDEGKVAYTLVLTAQ